jgi:hypothetical protein
MKWEENKTEEDGGKKEENEDEWGVGEEGGGSREGKTTLRFIPSAFLNFSEKVSYAF